MPTHQKSETCQTLAVFSNKRRIHGTTIGGTTIDNTIWKRLYKTAKENDTYGVFECAVDFENEVIDRWASGERDSFERLLCLCIQKTERMKRDLVPEGQMIPYQLGVIAGIVKSFERILRTEDEEDEDSTDEVIDNGYC